MGLSKTVTLVGVSSIVLVAVAIAVAVSLNKNHDDAKFSTANKSVKTMCEATDYKDACAKSLSSSNSHDPQELMKTSFKAAISDINEVVGKSKTLEDASKDSRTKDAYKLCKDLLETSVSDLDRSGDKIGKLEASKMDEYVADVQTWLTGAIDYQETCIDAFQNTTGDAGEKMKDLLKSSYELSSNSLAMVGDIKSIVSNLNIPGLHRRLFEYDYGPRGDPPPSEDPGSGFSTPSHRRLFDYDYGPRGDPPPSEDPGWGAGGSSRRLFEYDNEQPHVDPAPSEDPSSGASISSRKLSEYDYGPRGDPPPSEDPGWGAGGSSRRLFEYDNEQPHVDPAPSEDPSSGASISSRKLSEYDYGPRGDPPPSEDPGSGFSTPSHRRLFDYDYGPRGDPPPSEDPGWGAGGSHRRLFDYDYGPKGDPPPSEDPGWGAGGSHRRLFDYDYGPRGDPPPSEDPGWGAGGSHRRLFDYDYGPRGDPPPSEDPGWGAGGSHRRLFDAANGPPSDHSPTEDPGQGAEPVVRGVFSNDNETPSDNGSPSHNSEDISNGRNVASSKEIPEWVGTHHRNLLQANPKPNAVVALDGSGQFKSINEALKTVPPNNVKAFVILVKAGIYNEYVDVPRRTDNVVMIGEGATKTKVTGNKNFIDGVGTFQTATFVFQNCKMIVRKPMDNQGCMVTAQGRKDRRSTGGNILQNCQITAEPAFMQAKPPIKSYLGRPWKEFSRTVVMQSFIDSNIIPEGWSPWTGNFGQDTCYYAEYQNRGPGSDTSRRVAWKGVQKNLTPEVISQFTAGKFLQGDAWIPVAGIPYDSGMMKV
ncbi:hypothetical protein AG4045_019015 [Apium graveolens]|uniref:Pectinesterase inhibitor domain-containing protein n=1 Tax=Apium graveolens TaxID=4045 RepID=A0A6L5B7U7_APIGR|nr:hypothetical protein AG4045_019015 [Apium graveolens]